jgi:hypothetical protein
VPEQELDLLQFATTFVAQASACATKVMRCDVAKVAGRTSLFHNALFAVRPAHDRTGETTRSHFTDIRVQLHAILGLGEPEMKEIADGNSSALVSVGTHFKNGYGCSSSQLV